MTRKSSRRTPTGEKRREALMETAWGLFLEKGFSAVSVDEIVAKAGGSKSSVYEFFGSKEGLFIDIVSMVTRKILSEMVMPDIEGQSPREALTRICVASATQVLADRPLEIYRLVVSEAKHFPRIGKLFFDAGPGRMQVGLTEYFAKESKAGRLRIKDPRMAAKFLFGMLLMSDHLAMSVGCAKPPSRAAIRRTVDEVVDVFMSAYGA